MKRLVVSTILLLTVGTSFGMSEDIFGRQHPSEVTEVVKGYHILGIMPETEKAIDGLVRTIDGEHPMAEMTSTPIQGITLEELSHAVKGRDSVTPTAAVSHITEKPIQGITTDELLEALEELGQDKTTVYDGAQVLSILDTKLTKRLRFFKRIHNWHGDNNLDRSNRHKEAIELARNDKAEKGSYAWYVLKDLRHDILTNVEEVIQVKDNPLTGEYIALAIATAVNTNARHVKSEELRYYINELVWYSVTETTKELGK